MRKKLFTLLFAIIMVFTFSVACFAAGSPQAVVLPIENQETIAGQGEGEQPTSGGKRNVSDVSPKTGFELGGAFLVTISSLGVAFVSMKKFSEQ